MRIHLPLGVLCLCTLAAADASAQARDHVAELGIRFWKPSPELVLSTDGLADFGVGSVDFVQDLGIEEKRFRELRASIGRGHKFRVSVVKFDYEAETNIQRTIVFQGRTFNVGAPATTDVTWDIYTFGYEWDVVSRDRGFLGVVGDLKLNKVKGSIDSPALTGAATTDVTAPVPTIGVIGRGYLAPRIHVTAEFSGISLKRDSFDVSFYDWDLYGTVNLGDNVGVQGGYRSIDASYIVDEDSGDLKMKGLYFGGLVQF